MSEFREALNYKWQKQSNGGSENPRQYWMQWEGDTAGLGSKGNGQIGDMDQWSPVLGRAGREFFVCDGSKPEKNVAMDKQPMKLSEEVAPSGLQAIRMEDDSGERVLHALEFIHDIVRCTEKNRVGVVETRTDESMSNE